MASTLRGGLRPTLVVQGSTFIIWALAVLCAVYWGLKLSSGTGTLTAPPPVLRAPVAPDPAAVASLLASPSAPATGSPATPEATRMAVTGVVAGRSGGGVAIITVDGRPPRYFRVGSRVDEGLVLQSIQGRRALLGPSTDGPTTVTLELPSPS